MWEYGELAENIEGVGLKEDSWFCGTFWSSSIESS